MGGFEDDIPAPKRLKFTSEEHKDISNVLSIKDTVAVLTRNIMARSLNSGGGGDYIGSKGIIRKGEFIRVITKAMYSLGYEKTGSCLEEESGISLHLPVVKSFVQQILEGNWNESVATLNNFGDLDENILKSASFVIYEQKFFEFLDGGRDMDALRTLRTEITPLCINSNRVQVLLSYLLSPPEISVVGSSNQSTSRVKTQSKLLEELEELLPPSFLVPDRRLEQLVEQALSLQKGTCMFHNTLEKDMSLYADHKCGRDQLPSQTLQILEEHSDEVWFLQFSHNGKYLASSSNDQSAIIWEVDEGGRVSLKHRLSGHNSAVSSVSWSPDDNQILTCGMDEAIMRWDVSSGQCLHVFESVQGCVSCCWFPNGRYVLSGLKNKSICMWDLSGNEIDTWNEPRTLRISDLEITNDGKKIISIYKEKTILLHDREANVGQFIQEDSVITSFSLSRDKTFLLVNLWNEEIHLWNIRGELKLNAVYKGHKRNRFVIRACFGGLEEAFIASGSEDSQVYIWHRNSKKLIEVLAGHSGSVNCVSWNPANPHMLASASDDRTIRIWGIKDLDRKCKSVDGKGVHYSNGRSSKQV